MSQQESYMGVSSNLIKEKISNFKEYESKASALFLSYAQEKNEIEQRIFKITELTNSSSENYLGNYLKQYEIVLEGNEYNEQKAISGNLDSLLEPFRKTAEMKLYGASILANKMGEVLSEDEIKELHLEEDENLEVFQGQIKKIKGQLQELKSSTIEDTKKSIYNFRSSIYKEQSAAATRKNLGIGIGFFAVLGLVSLILLVIGIATVSPLLIVGIILLGISILLIIILGASRAKMQTNNTSIYRDKMRVSYNTFYNNFKKNIQTILKRYNTYLEEAFNPNIEKAVNILKDKLSILKQNCDKDLEKIRKEFEDKPLLSVDQQQLYYSLEAPERKEFLKLGALISKEEDLIEVYQKCIDISLKRKSLEEQKKQTKESQKQTQILDETKNNNLEHQRMLEQQNESLKRVQEAQLFAEEEAAREAARQADIQIQLLRQQNTIISGQSKEVKRQTKELKRGNKELENQHALQEKAYYER